MARAREQSILADGPLDPAFWTGDVESWWPGVFRAGLAALLLGDTLLAIPDIDALYGPDGLWPAALGGGALTAISSAGLHLVWFAGCAALTALLLGWFSRLAALLSWLFLLAVHQRNPAIVTAGDQFAQTLVLFFVCFDCGAAFSLDARLRGKGRAFIAAAPWRAMQLHLAALYFLTAYCKVKEGWLHGDGVFISLQHEGVVRPLGTWLLQHPLLCKLNTWLVLLLESVYAFLALSPFYGRSLRLLALVFGVVLQLGVLATMRVGVFTPIMLWVNLLLVPLAIRPATEAAQVPRRWLGAALGAAVVLLLASGLFGGKRWPQRKAIEPLLATVGLVQYYDLFGAEMDVREWFASGTEADGRAVDVLAAAGPGMQTKPGWSFASIYKVTAASETDYAAVCRWLCRSYQSETGHALQTIELWKNTRKPLHPGETRPFERVLLHAGTCAALEAAHTVSAR